MDELTPKQENFCQHFIISGNASQAYRDSYDVGPDTKPETIWTEASKLLQNPKVTQRVTDLREQLKEAAVYTLFDALEELEAARMFAMDNKNPSAVVSAVNSKIKLHGFEAPQKLEHSGPGGSAIQTQRIVQDVDNMSPEHQKLFLEFLRHEINLEEEAKQDAA